MTFALDTNTLIYFFKGAGRVAEHLLNTHPRSVLVPAVVVYELEVGIRKSSQPEKRTRQLGLLIDSVRVAPFDHLCAQTAAAIRTELELRGTPIGPLDLLIAATALANDAILVTRNTDEFARIPGLRFVDWY